MSTNTKVPCRGFFRRDSSFLALTVLFTFFLIFTAKPAFTQGVVASGIFELDGNAVNDDGDVDWDDLIPGTGGPIWDVDETKGLIPVTAKNDFSDTDKIFTNGGGTKDFKDVSTWHFRTGDPGPKFDLTNAYAAFASDLNGDYIFFGQDRQESNGDAQLGFWFLQTPQLSLPAGDTGVFNCQMGADGLCHVLGDILVLADFSNGGAIANIKVFRWNPDFSPASIKARKNCDETDNIQRLGDTNAVPAFSLGTHGDWSDSSCNTAADANSVAGGLFGVCGDDPGDLACAITNASGTRPVNWGYRGVGDTDPVVEQGFFEGGMNIAALLDGETPCFSNAVAESRASDSVSSILKDFVLLDFNICDIDVSKTCEVTDLAIGSGNFFAGTADITVTNPGPGGFTTGILEVTDTISDPLGSVSFIDGGFGGVGDAVGTVNANGNFEIDIAQAAFGGFAKNETITFCNDLVCNDSSNEEGQVCTSNTECTDDGGGNPACDDHKCDFPAVGFLTDLNGPTNTTTATLFDVSGGDPIVAADVVTFPTAGANKMVPCDPIPLSPMLDTKKECSTFLENKAGTAPGMVKVLVDFNGYVCNSGDVPLFNVVIDDPTAGISNQLLGDLAAATDVTDCSSGGASDCTVDADFCDTNNRCALTGKTCTVATEATDCNQSVCIVATIDPPNCTEDADCGGVGTCDGTTFTCQSITERKFCGLDSFGNNTACLPFGGIYAPTMAMDSGGSITTVPGDALFMNTLTATAPESSNPLLDTDGVDDTDDEKAMASATCPLCPHN